MKSKTRKRTEIIARSWGQIIVLGIFLMGLNSAVALAVDFVTQTEFEAEKSAYKNYPLNILFKKLSESDASEKRIIRNTIILKQVFDRNMQKMEKEGIIAYKETYGLIKGIDRNSLKLWVPATNRFVDFYVGVDRIPLLNEHGYNITALSIDKYAAVVYTLDNRIYKIQISFLPEAPRGLNVKRENDNNIVAWNPPPSARKPFGYKVFVNEKLLKQVEGTTVKIPRKAGQVDNYYVKAIYKHGDGIVDSDASDILVDEITAGELQQKQLAEETYNRVVAALNPSEWETAEALLYDNQQLLSQHLGKERQQNTAQLIAFFREIDKGDSFSGAAPVSIQNLQTAILSYERAAQKAQALPAGMDVAFIPRLKVDESRGRIAQLQTQQEQNLAGKTYDRIVAALNPSQWQEAKNLLYDNQELLSEYLDDAGKKNASGLTGFFREIDEGDRLAQTSPATIQSIESALMFYQRADKKAQALPAGIDVRFISRLRIDESRNRVAQLETRQKERLADERYDRIIAALNPSEWQNAEALLFDSQKFLNENLDDVRKQNTARLVAFFKEINEGERLGNLTPVTIENLESALAVYQRAEQKANAMPAGIDVLFIPRLKINESKSRIAQLQTRQNKELAGETYDGIITALNPSQWQDAEKRLYDNQQFLSEYLDDELKQNAVNLIAFFREIDGGDSLAQKRPESIQTIESALMLYERARQKAQAMPEGIDVLFIPQLKIDETNGRIERLKAQQTEQMAVKTYESIVAALNPSEWQAAEKRLYDNQQFLSEHLDETRKRNVVQLIAFFKEIDAGDRLARVTPETIETIGSALKTYQDAGEMAEAMPDPIDVTFISHLKIEESRRGIARLETREKDLTAANTYDRIITALTPSEWQTAQALLYDNRQLLSDYLDETRKRNTATLIDIFREIDEGDRYSRATPRSLPNLMVAQTFYQRAEQKAKTLPSSIDIAFIPRLRIEENQGHITALKEQEQEMVAARSPQAASSAVAVKTSEPVEENLDPKTRVKVAMRKFKTRDYPTSLNHFKKIYGKQIAALGYTGNRRIRALLSLPTKHRAEVIFLTELDRLKKENDNDEDLVRQELETVYEQIDNGEGVWSIIPDSKRRKIMRHIERYGP